MNQSKLLSNSFYKVLLSVVSVSLGLATLLFVFPALTVYGAEFESGDDVVINQTKENLYVSGSNVVVDAITKKDLVVAGGTVEVNKSVERSLIGAGGVLKVNNATIGASARVAGGEVILDNVIIEEDLVVAGGTVTIKNSRIKGDLVLSTDELTLTSTVVEGRGFINYTSNKGDNVEDSIQGEVFKQTEERGRNNDSSRAGSGSAFVALGYGFRGEIAIICATLILIWYLGKRNRLEIPSIKFDKKFWINLLITLGSLLVGGLSVILFAFFAIIPILGTITATPLFLTLATVVLMLILLSESFILIYSANLVKSYWLKEVSIRNVVFITIGLFIVVKLVMLIPVIGWVVGFGYFLLSASCVGFVLRSLYNAINCYLAPREGDLSEVVSKE